MYSNPFQGLAGGYMHVVLGASSEYGAVRMVPQWGDCDTLHGGIAVVHDINRYTPAITAGR